MGGPECPGSREIARQVAELQAQVAELNRKLEAAQRTGKRQAAPTGTSSTLDA